MDNIELSTFTECYGFFRRTFIIPYMLCISFVCRPPYFRLLVTRFGDNMHALSTHRPIYKTKQTPQMRQYTLPSYFQIHAPPKGQSPYWSILLPFENHKLLRFRIIADWQRGLDFFCEGVWIQIELLSSGSYFMIAKPMCSWRYMRVYMYA